MSIGEQNESEQKVVRLTPEGHAKYQERLDLLRNVTRKEVADFIHDAKEAGDISESSAYEEAKNRQAMVEGEIRRLEVLLSMAQVMTPDMHDGVEGPPTVRIGMEVDLTNNSNGVHRVFKIVETFEADPKTGMISDQSPVGKALMGHKEGDVVEVSTPGGVTSYTIKSIRSMF